jgi:hypothetical protein
METKMKKIETRWPQVPVCFYVSALALETPEEAPKTFRSQAQAPLVAVVVLGGKYLVGILQRGGFEDYETERER